MQSPKNVYIIGAQSTGKTTLLRALQKHYSNPQNRGAHSREPAIITEVARRVLAENQIDRDDIANTPEKCEELQRAILDAQYNAETNLTRDPSVWYISDRSAVDPAIYARLYAGRDAAQRLLELSHWEVLELNMNKGLVVLCEAGCAWLTDDGVRLMPKDAEEWVRTHHAFEELLKERGIEYIVVPKDVESIGERVGMVLRALG